MSMESISKLADVMNTITLDEEEEAVISIEEEEGVGVDHQFGGINAKLCVVARFITEGQVDFPAMQ